jgi:hypothetical protein
MQVITNFFGELVTSIFTVETGKRNGKYKNGSERAIPITLPKQGIFKKRLERTTI